MTDLDLNLLDAVRLGVASPHEMRQAADVVRTFKSQGNMLLRGSASPKPVIERAAINREARSITYAGSVEIVDRMGDLILQRGWETDNWSEHGGVFLWIHDHGDIIGQGIQTGLGQATYRGAQYPAQLFEIGYLSEDLNPASEVVWRLASGQGTPTGRPLLKGVSVGFRGLDMRAFDSDEREKYGLPDDHWGLVFERQDLLELSQAPVPANQGAFTLSDTKADRKFAAQVDEALGHMVSEGQISASLERLFRERYQVSPGEAAKKAAERAKSFTDLGSWEWPKAAAQAVTEERGAQIPEKATDDTEKFGEADDVTPATERAESVGQRGKGGEIETLDGLLDVVRELTPDGVSSLRRLSVTLERARMMVDRALDDFEAAQRACSGGSNSDSMVGERATNTDVAELLQRVERLEQRGQTELEATPAVERGAEQAIDFTDLLDRYRPNAAGNQHAGAAR